MKCKDCVLKHLAAAISYGKEIIAGHGYDGTPDHRADFLGELVNAEHHLAQMSASLLNRVMIIRTAEQAKHMTPTNKDIDELRSIWVDVEKTPLEDMDPPVVQATAITLRNGTQFTTAPSPLYPGLDHQGSIGVLLDERWNDYPDRKALFLKMASVYFRGADPYMDRQDLADYDKEWLWVFPVNVFVTREVAALQPVHNAHQAGAPVGTTMRLVKASALKLAMNGNPDKTCTELLDILSDSDCPKGTRHEDNVCVFVNKQPCCGMKSRLQRTCFVRVDDNGWPFMQKIWEDTNA